MPASKTANGREQTLPTASVNFHRPEKVQTEFEFVLPHGYVDNQGMLHKRGVMRLATALDEIAPLRDPRVRANQAYVTIIVLARVVTKLGSLPDINSGVIESLFTMDMAYLQEFYRTINNQAHAFVKTHCPECAAEIEVDLGTGDSRNLGGNDTPGE